MASLLQKIISKLLSHPQEVTLELSAHCNLQCKLCAAERTFTGQKAGYMDVSKAKTLLSELKNKTSRIRYSGRGEPTMHPDVWEIVRHSSKLNLPSFVDTNANLIKKMNPDEIIDSGLERIFISLDGLIQETYEHFRTGGKLENVKYVIEQLVQAKKDKNSIYPIVHVGLILTKQNEHQVKQLKDYLPKGVNKISISHVWVPGHFKRNDPEEHDDLVTSFVPEQGRYNGFDILTPNKRCGDFERAWIHWDGTLAGCWYDTKGEAALSNVFEDGFFPVWKEEKTRIHKTLVKHKKLPRCQTCHQSNGYLSKTI